jgi:hypothetical protein
MDNHRTVLAVLFAVLGVMGLIGSAVLGTAAATEPDVPAILTFLPVGFGLFICMGIAVATIPSLVAAYGLLQRRSWARVWVLVAGILNLPSFPFGTGVGIYAIWFFVQEENVAGLPGRTGPPGV